MMRNILVAMLMAGLTVVAAADTVYKWSDGRGQIHYTDLPPTQADAKILSVSHQQSEFLEDESDGDEGDDGNDGGGPTTLPSGNSFDEPSIDREAMAAVQADVSKAKTKQCKEAQDRYQRYIDSRRLFRETEDGKREYLTDEQLAAARVRAKQSIDEYCN